MKLEDICNLEPQRTRKGWGKEKRSNRSAEMLRKEATNAEHRGTQAGHEATLSLKRKCSSYAL